MTDAQRIDAQRAHERIRTAAVEAALQFSNGEIANNWLEKTDRNVARAAFSLRDGVTYRFDAILEAAETVDTIQQAAQARILDALIGDDGSGLQHMALQQRFAFDNLLFNSIALFDYIGRYAALMLEADESLKLRWDRVYKWAKHPNAGGRRGNHIHGTRIGEQIINADERWVRRLYGYRSEVIHYQSEAVGSGVSIWMKRGEAGSDELLRRFETYVPRGFVRALKLGGTEERIAITAAARLIVGAVFTAAESLLQALAEDLKERVPSLPPGAVTSRPMSTKAGDGA